MIEDFVEKNDDPYENEKAIRQSLVLGPEEDMSIIKAKTLKVDASIYSASYFAFMKENKKKYGMTQVDQFDLLRKALFILAVQVFFIWCVMTVSKVKFVLHNDMTLQICLFFTTLLLHLGCIPGARSAMYMMRYALTHPESFTHPRVAFLLGLTQFMTMIFAELVNIMKGSERKKP